MKRAISLSAIFLVIDQLVKWYFQNYFVGRSLHIVSGFGFTYTTNPGIWLNNNISTVALLFLQVLAIFFWIFILYLMKYYQAYYRKSIYTDISFGLFTTAVFGNFLDRLLYGFARDFLINPIAISNFADIAGSLALVFFALEFIVFPKARPLLRIGKPKDLLRNLKVFIDFVRGRNPEHRLTRDSQH